MKIALALTGASGAIYAKVLLDQLKEHQNDFEAVALVMSDNAKTVWKEELADESYLNYPFQYYNKNDFYAPIASGSAGYDALIICPCSMGTMARIAQGSSNDLITRAADVMLKERKKLICVIRESPYNLVHIKNMALITEAGGIICPASPSFYSLPKNIEELALTISSRALQLAGVNIKHYQWGSSAQK